MIENGKEKTVKLNEERIKKIFGRRWHSIIIILISLITMICTVMFTYEMNVEKNFDIDDAKIGASTSIMVPSEEDFQYMTDNSDEKVYIRYLLTYEKINLYLCQGYINTSDGKDTIYFYKILGNVDEEQIEIVFENKKITVDKDNTLGVLTSYKGMLKIKTSVEIICKHGKKDFKVLL